MLSMKYSYYPGCTLRNKAKDLDEYARASARALGFELEEIEDWQCCGGVYPLGTDEIATKLSSVRALNQAKEKGQDLVTICSACHHVIKRVNDDMKNVEDIRTRANNYMQLDEPYAGETTVLHYLEVLRDKLAGTPPSNTINEVGFPLAAFLVGKIAVHSHREAGDSDTGTGPAQLGVTGQAAHDDNVVEHWITPPQRWSGSAGRRR